MRYSLITTVLKKKNTLQKTQYIQKNAIKENMIMFI